MKYRILKYNASASQTPAWRWKIQFKRGRLWRDFRTVQGVKVFDNPFHAENYMKLLTLPKTTNDNNGNNTGTR